MKDIYEIVAEIPGAMTSIAMQKAAEFGQYEVRRRKHLGGVG